MTKFHSEDYIRFLRSVRLHDEDNASECNKQMRQFHLEEDCPTSDGLYEFCQSSVP